MKKFMKSMVMATGLVLMASPVTSALASTTQTATVSKSKWELKGGKWYYCDRTGKLTKGWAAINYTWYYFDAAGVMQTGWEQVNGKWYYLDANGKMKIGWLQSGGAWYYLKSSGEMFTGWLQQGESWYYMNPSGKMQTGWKKIEGKWYHFKSGGKMSTGWVYENGWYYMKPTGSMVTGWKDISDGYSSDRYYFNPSGKMMSGWQVIDGKKYYFSERSNSFGAMQTGLTIDGYILGRDGALMDPGSEMIQDSAKDVFYKLKLGQTRDEVLALFGDTYSTYHTDFLWNYTFKVNDSDGSVEIVDSSFSHGDPFALAERRYDVDLMIHWNEDETIENISISYFGADHRLKLVDWDTQRWDY